MANSAGEPVLQVQKVRQSFRSGFLMGWAHILHDVDMVVPRHSVYGFLGANGAGKTTLIHLIVGLLRPKSGEITIEGIPSIERMARAKVGYLPERPYFPTHLTATALLEYFGTLSGMSRSRLKERIPVVLEQVGLGHAKNLALKKFSKGMLQRAGIAQAIIHDPSFLVLDEPMSGLDPVGRKEIRSLIERLRDEGRTILFSTHVIPDVEAICDNIGIIRKGKMVGSGSVESFLAEREFDTEILCSGIHFDQLKDWNDVDQVTSIPDGLRIVLGSKRDQGEVLSRLISLKAKINGVTPMRPSLEELFEEHYR